MPSDKPDQSLSENWSERYDDRDDEAIACLIWARQLALREKAMANPIKGSDTQDEIAPVSDRPTTATEPKPA